MEEPSTDWCKQEVLFYTCVYLPGEQLDPGPFACQATAKTLNISSHIFFTGPLSFSGSPVTFLLWTLHSEACIFHGCLLRFSLMMIASWCILHHLTHCSSPRTSTLSRKLLLQPACRSPPTCYYCMNNKNKTQRQCFMPWPPEGRLGSILEW